jgi:hypothetical protein
LKRDKVNDRPSTPRHNTASPGSWGKALGVDMHGVDASVIFLIALQAFEA